MSETWQTIGLSFATSLIVSLITFILGLKSGKNQADRAKLQDLYKNLYSHFSDLKDSLNKNRPKSWKNYKKVERGIYSVEYFPPVKELHRTGDILFIKNGSAHWSTSKRKTSGQIVSRLQGLFGFLLGLCQLGRLLGLPIVQQGDNLILHLTGRLVLAEILFQFCAIDNHVAILLFLFL